MLRKYRYLLIPAVLVIGFLVIHMVGAAGTTPPPEPGSDGDPIVTQSYVDQKVQEIRNYTDAQNAEIRKRLDVAGIQGQKFVVVEALDVGKRLIADESTEIILRAGKVTAITSEQGGLSDVTAGRDIKEGENVPMNHLIIVPRTDGRGVKATATAVLLVKGMYRIE